MGGSKPFFCVLLASLAIGATGCFSPSAEAQAELAQVKAETADLDQALAGLEDRFLGNQYTVQLWQEMARRHQQVSEIACKVHSAQFAEMAEFMERQAEKARALKRPHRVATVSSLVRGTEPQSQTR